MTKLKPVEMTWKDRSNTPHRTSTISGRKLTQEKLTPYWILLLVQTNFKDTTVMTTKREPHLYKFSLPNGKMTMLNNFEKVHSRIPKQEKSTNGKDPCHMTNTGFSFTSFSSFLLWLISRLLMLSDFGKEVEIKSRLEVVSCLKASSWGNTLICMRLWEWLLLSLVSTFSEFRPQ